MCDDVRKPMSTSNAGMTARGMTPEEKVDVMFTYHQPDERQLMQYGAIRDAAKHLAHVILHNTPRCPDQTAALRRLSESVMTANAAIARRGVSI